MLREELDRKANLEEVKDSLDHIADVVDKKVYQEDLQELLGHVEGIEEINLVLPKKADRDEIQILLNSKID